MGREDYIHLKLRSHLKSIGFRLIAGQYPNGSDDELHILTIRVAGDVPRSYHLNSFVPDLIAMSEKDMLILIIEIKPKRSISDEEKLLTLLSDYRNETITALRDHSYFSKANRNLQSAISSCTIEPAVSFYGDTISDELNPSLHYFLFSKEKDSFLTRDARGNANGI